MMENCFLDSNVRFCTFICEIGVSGFILPLNVKLCNSGQLFITNVAKQMIKEILIIDD